MKKVIIITGLVIIALLYAANFCQINSGYRGLLADHKLTHEARILTCRITPYFPSH